MNKCDMCKQFCGDIKIEFVNDLNLKVISIRNEVCKECFVNKLIKIENKKVLDLLDIKDKKDIKKTVYYYWKDKIYMFWKKSNKIYVFKEFFYKHNFMMVELGVVILWKEKDVFKEEDILTKEQDLFVKYFFEAKLNRMFFTKKEQKLLFENKS